MISAIMRSLASGWRQGGSPDESRGAFEAMDDDSSPPLGDVSVVDSEGHTVSATSAPTAFKAALLNGVDVTVTPDTAMALSAVYACIERISSNIAMMPATIKEKKNGGSLHFFLSNLLLLIPLAGVMDAFGLDDQKVMVFMNSSFLNQRTCN